MLYICSLFDSLITLILEEELSLCSLWVTKCGQYNMTKVLDVLSHKAFLLFLRTFQKALLLKDFERHNIWNSNLRVKYATKNRGNFAFSISHHHIVIFIFIHKVFGGLFSTGTFMDVACCHVLLIWIVRTHSCLSSCLL